MDTLTSLGPWIGPLIGSLLIAMLGFVATRRSSANQWRLDVAKTKLEWEENLDTKTAGFIDRLEKDRTTLTTRLDTEAALRKADREISDARYSANVAELASCRDSEGRQYAEIVELRRRIMDLAMISVPNGNGAKSP